MFEIAILGPISADRLGVVRQCIDCRRAMGPGAPPCTGFGPGCLVPPKPLQSPQRAFCPG